MIKIQVIDHNLMGKMSGILKKMNKTSGFKTKKTVLDGIFH